MDEAGGPHRRVAGTRSRVRRVRSHDRGRAHRMFHVKHACRPRTDGCHCRRARGWRERRFRRRLVPGRQVLPGRRVLQPRPVPCFPRGRSLRDPTGGDVPFFIGLGPPDSRRASAPRPWPWTCLGAPSESCTSVHAETSPWYLDQRPLRLPGGGAAPPSQFQTRTDPEPSSLAGSSPGRPWSSRRPKRRRGAYRFPPSRQPRPVTPDSSGRSGAAQRPDSRAPPPEPSKASSSSDPS